MTTRGNTILTDKQRQNRRTLAETCQEFRNRINELATKYNKLATTIYDWWLDYSEDCKIYDQSPVLSEFENWYAEKLST